MRQSHPRRAAFRATAVLLAILPVLLACGGGSGGAGPDGAGQGLILLDFEQANVDNLPLNQILRFTFSEALDPASVTPASLQIRVGDSFGLTAAGTLRVAGSVVTFEPNLPGRCDYSDAGFQPDTEYRIALIGAPEAFSIRNSVGQPLESTATHQFHTLAEGDPDLLRDSLPGEPPHALSVTPSDGSAEIPVMQGNEIVIELSENIDPCTIDTSTVLFQMVEVGDVAEGFIPVEDNSEDPFTWGSTNAVTTVSPAQRIPSAIVLEQDFESARLTITPDFGEFPENALLLLRLSVGIRDFGGTPLTPLSLSFTTENQPAATGSRTLEFDATTPIDDTGTTADVNTARSPGIAQGFLLFSGDGDNGADPYTPSLPNTTVSSCGTPFQANDGTKDVFFPGSDVNLDTGSTVNTCPNTVDGSTAVVWEFKSFHIPNGVTVRVTGRNPAIILVQDEILIESGGRLQARGDGQNGSAQGTGGNGSATSTSSTLGGTGSAGGGDGGDGPEYPAPSSGRYGEHGSQGYFTTSTGAIDGEVGDTPGTGGGEGNTSGYWVTQTTCNRNLPSGGGGGHATAGGDGTALGSGTSPVLLDLSLLGGGGGTYGSSDGRMRRAEAGSGGGAGGELRSYAGTAARGPGGAGGAGGGFVDLTCSGNITILGTIDAAGGRGGNGAGNPFSPNYTYNPGTGGGGGGSGGGIRLISAREIVLGATAILTAAGGVGGAGGTNQGTAVPVNNGGGGGVGRIVLEDVDAVIEGLATASVTPGVGVDGFFSGPFDPTRFSGGGVSTEALTQPILAGPIPFAGLSPAFLEPESSDIVAGIPQVASRGPGATGILVEARGWSMTVDGDVDAVAGPSAWATVGSYEDSGTPAVPTWKPAATRGIPADITLPPDNPGTLLGLGPLAGYAYLQVRLTLYLPATATPLTPGPYVDRLSIRFTYDQ
jgi:hypothetical protein